MDPLETVLARYGFERSGLQWKHPSTGRLVLQTGDRLVLTTAGGRELGRAFDAGSLGRLLDFWSGRG